MSADEPTLDEQVEALFPLGGPYDGDTTRAAAQAIVGLVRYLGHATRHAESVPDPNTVDAVVGSLAGAVFGLDQLLRQLGWRLDRQVARLCSDRGGDASDMVVGVLIHLDNARDYLGLAAHRLQDAASDSGHLAVREDR